MKKLNNKKQKKGILIVLSIMLVLVAIIGGGQAYYRLKSNKLTETKTVVEELDTYNDFYTNTENLNKQNSIIIASKDVNDYQGANSVYTLGDMTYLTYPSEEQAENALNIYKENGYTAEKDVITEFNLEELEEQEEKVVKDVEDPIQIPQYEDSLTKVQVEDSDGHSYTTYESDYNKFTVAVLDSGINYSDELKGRLVYTPKLYYEDGTSELSKTWVFMELGGQSRQFEDSYNHGTQIAKIIAENTNANVQIASYNVIDDNGKIYTSALVSAIYDCIAKDVKVINMSLTTRGYSEILEYAIKDAMEHGITVVAAAGNYGEDASGYTPANISGVVTVGAYDENGNIADYSNYGENVDCLADGNVYSVDGEIILKGTSFSAARVSAYTARILSRSFTFNNIPEILNDFATGAEYKEFKLDTALNFLASDNRHNSKYHTAYLSDMKEHKTYKQIKEEIEQDENEYDLQGDYGTFYFQVQNFGSNWNFWPACILDSKIQEETNNGYSNPAEAAYRADVAWHINGSGQDNSGDCTNFTHSWDSNWDQTGKFWNTGSYIGQTPYTKIYIGTWSGYDLDYIDDSGMGGMQSYEIDSHTIYVDCGEYKGKWMNSDGTTNKNYREFGSTSSLYVNWKCNHSGATEEIYYDGNNPDNCGYYHCTRCNATWGTWGHQWNSTWSYNSSTHWHYCDWSHSHWKDEANHNMYLKTDECTNSKSVYKCRTCEYRYEKARYELNTYIINQKPDGSWESPLHWCGKGAKYNTDGLYLEAGEHYETRGYGTENGPDNPIYEVIHPNFDMPAYNYSPSYNAYRQTRTVDINTRFSSDGSDNYAAYNSGLDGITYAVWTNGNYDHNYDINHKVLDWCYPGIRVGATFDISVFTNPGYHTEFIGQYELNQGIHKTFTNSNKYSQEYSIESTLPETYNNKCYEAFVKPNLYHYKFNLNIPLKATQPETARYNTPNETNTYDIYYNNSLASSAVVNKVIPTPSLHGWSFVGWNTKADGTGDWYKTDTVYKQTSDLNLYAIWQQTQYTVRLSAAVGSTEHNSTGYNLGENLSDKLDNSTQQKLNLTTYQDSNNNLTLGNITWKYVPNGNNSYYEAVFTYDEPQSIYDYDAYFHLSYFVGNGWYYNGAKIRSISSYANNNIKFNLIDLVNNGNGYLDGPNTNIITLTPLYKINNVYSIDTRNQEGNLESIDYYRRFYTGQTVTYDMLMLMNPNKNRSEDDFRLINSFTTLNLSDLTSYPITKKESARTSGNNGNTQTVNPISVIDDFSTDYMRDNLEIEKLIFKDINGNSISSISGTNLRNNAKSGIKVPDNARSYEVIFRATDDGWVEVNSDWNSRAGLNDVQNANGGYKPNNGDSSKVYKHTEPRTIRASYTGTILQNNAPTLKETPVRIYKEQIESWTALNDKDKEIEELKTTILKYQVVSDFEDNNDKLSNWFKSEIQSQILRNSMTITDIHKGTKKEDGSTDYSTGSSIKLEDIIENIHNVKDNQYYEVTITIKDSFDKETKQKVHLYVIYNPADFDVNESNNVDRVVYMPTNITGKYTLSDSIISHNLQGTTKEGLLNSSYSKVDGTPVETEEYKFNSGSIYNGSGSVKIIEY